DHVAWPQVRMPRDRLFDRVTERAQEARYAVALGDELAIGIRNADAEVEHLVDDRALRGALQRDEHLVADRRETLSQHVHGEPVGAALARLRHGVDPVRLRHDAHWRTSGTTFTLQPPIPPG